STPTPTPTPTGTPCAACTVATSFNSTSIAAGRYIWFNSILPRPGGAVDGTTVFFENQTITFKAGTTNYVLNVPKATVTYSAAATSASTYFDGVTLQWVTTVPLTLNKNAFLAGMALQVPAGGFPGNISPVTWSGSFASNTPTVTNTSWQWA